MLDGLLAAVEGSQRRRGSVFILVRRRVLDGLVRMRSGRPVFHGKHAGGRGARWLRRRGREIAAAAGLGLHPGATKGAMAPSRRGRDIRCSTGNTRGSGCAMASSPRSRDRSGGGARSSSGAINGCSMVSPREVGHQVSERPLQAAGVSRRTPRRASIDSRAKNSENSAAAILTGYPQGSSQGLPGCDSRQLCGVLRDSRTAPSDGVTHCNC